MKTNKFAPLVNQSTNIYSYLVLGLLVSYVSIAAGQIFFSAARIICIVLGLALLGYAASTSMNKVSANEKFALGLLVIVAPLILVFHAILLKQQIDLNFTNTGYLFVCSIFLGLGYCLSKIRGPAYGFQVLLLPAGFVVLVLMLYFERYVRSNFIYAAGRSFGLDDLNPISVGYNFMILAVVCSVVCVLEKNIFTRIVFGINALIACVIVIGSASRGPLVWGIISILLLFVSFIKANRVRVNKQLMTLLIIVPALVLVAMVFFGNELMKERTEVMMARFSLLGDTGTDDDGTSGRVTMWKDYLADTHKMTVAGMVDYSPYPHNQFIELVVRFGLFGLILVPCSLYLIAKSVIFLVIDGSPKYPVDFLLLILFVYCWLMSMSSLSLEMNRALWLGVGYVVGIKCVKFKRIRVVRSRSDN